VSGSFKTEASVTDSSNCRKKEVGSDIQETGAGVGMRVGAGVGMRVGAGVGMPVGAGVGMRVGASVGVIGLGVGTCEELLLENQYKNWSERTRIWPWLL
jgi:hypothetical protein